MVFRKERNISEERVSRNSAAVLSKLALLNGPNRIELNILESTLLKQGFFIPLLSNDLTQ